MQIEFQLNAGKLLAVFLNRLRTVPICIPNEFPLNLDACAVQTTGGGAQLCISVAGIEAADEIPPALVAAVQVLGATELPSSCTPFDLSPLNQMIGGPPSIANAGASSDGGFSFLAIRLEVGAPSSSAAAAWTSFFAGSISNHLFGNDWSVFVDKNLVLPVIEDQVSSAIDEYNSDHWYDYNIFWGPDATWSHPNDKPQITVKLDGELEQACVCFVFPQDIEMEFHSIIDLSIEQDNRITSTIHIETISHDDFSISCCASTNMLAWAVLGPHYLEEKPAEEFWGLFLLGWG